MGNTVWLELRRLPLPEATGQANHQLLHQVLLPCIPPGLRQRLRGRRMSAASW